MFNGPPIPITVVTTLLAERYDERGSTEALEEAIKIMEEYVEADNQGHAPLFGLLGIKFLNRVTAKRDRRFRAWQKIFTKPFYFLQSMVIEEVCCINHFIDLQILDKILSHRYEETCQIAHLTTAVSSEESLFCSHRRIIPKSYTRTAVPDGCFASYLTGQKMLKRTMR